MTLHRSAARPSLPRKGHARTQVAALDALIERMMAPDPSARFASYEELLRAIELASAAHTRPAGVLVRGCAFLIDMLLARALVGLIQLPLADDSPVTMGLVGLPLLAVLTSFFLSRWGMTPGMALFELEVVALDTARRPSVGRAVKRTAALGAVPIAIAVTSHIAATVGIGHWIELFDMAGMATALIFGALAIYAVWRVPGKRAPWDRASNTMVRYRTGRRSAAS